jgi:hypothetical protein
MNEFLLTTTEQSDLERLSKIVDQAIQKFHEGMAALSEIRERKLWRGEAKSFDEFCQKRFRFGKRRANQMIAAGKIILALPDKVGTLVPTEAAARALKKVPKENRIEVIQHAASHGEVNSATIKKAAAKLSEPPPEPVDAMGYPIPKSAQKYMDWAEEVRGLRNELRRIKALIVSADEAMPKMFVECNIETMKMNLQSVFSDLGNALPFAVCPSCQARNGATKCDLCRGRGLVSKFRWNVTVPDELKQLRQKQIQKLAK